MLVSLLTFAVGCGGGDEEAAENLVRTLVNSCTQSGGAVDERGRQSCDFKAVISVVPGPVADANNPAAKAAIEGGNADTSEDCEAAAQAMTVQCKFDQLSADTATCQAAAAGFVQQLNTYKGPPAALQAQMISSTYETTGADCTNAFKDAFMTFKTGWNGKMADSEAGCKLLTGVASKLLRGYAGRLAPGGLAAAMGMGAALQGTSACPAKDFMSMVFNSLSSGAASSVASSSYATAASPAPTPQDDPIPLDPKLNVVDVNGFKAVY